VSELLLFFHSSLCYFWARNEAFSVNYLASWLSQLAFIYLFCSSPWTCLKVARPLCLYTICIAYFVRLSEKFFIAFHEMQERVRIPNSIFPGTKTGTKCVPSYRIKYFAPKSLPEIQNICKHIYMHAALL